MVWAFARQIHDGGYLMKRILSLLLMLVMLLPMSAVPVFAAEDMTISSQEAVFPSDCTLGDLYIVGDCPENIILINVKIEGKLYIEADHAVTVRMQGSSSCADAEVYSKATLVGGKYGNVLVDTAYVAMDNTTAETVRMEQEGSLLSVNGEVDVLTLFNEDQFVGGSGRADKVVIEEEGCTVNLRCGSIMDYTKENEVEIAESSDIRADFDINPTISPSNSIVNAKVTFTNIPDYMAGDYRIYWYIGDTLSFYEWSFDLKEGASASFQCSAHFYEDVSVMPVWVKLVNKSTDQELRFVTKVNVVDYNLNHYESMDTTYPYEIHLLRNHNVIIVYGLDEKGEFTKIVNVFPCSTGYYNETDLGEFEIGLQMRWGSLMLDLYGQYSSQFNYNQLFHSVPYWSKDQNNIEWEEYEKLGEAASSGCVRLSTIDAKWIYDFCHTGTKVKVYDTDVLPVVKPIECVILEDYIFRGWDPTDPDPDNPTKPSDPPVMTALNVKADHPVYSAFIN